MRKPPTSSTAGNTDPGSSRQDEPEESPPDRADILFLQGVGKRFPGVTALADVDFSLRRGEVHALVGQNGAGKSTLVRIITGVYPPDAGLLFFRGDPYAPASPADAQRRGIRTIYQELDLIPALSVAENLSLGRFPRRAGFIRWKRVRRDARRSLERFGIDLDVTAPLGSFPPAVQQMVAVARAVDVRCDVLVMDEPTSSLDPEETERLFGHIRRLRSEGMAILFITHFIDEIYRIADRITILRDGRRVGTWKANDLSRVELISRMIGREPEEVAAASAPRRRRASARPDRGRPFLAARGLGRRRVLEPVDLEIPAGTIVGLAGLLGSGRTELARLIFGLDRPTHGRIEIDGVPARIRDPRRAIRHRLGFCPEDRRAEGIVPGLSVHDNIVLVVRRRLSRFGLRPRRERKIVERLVERLGIVTTGPNQPIEQLSGGNQQKAILARWLAADPRLLILDEPTRGIDVGAKAEIMNLVASLAEDGVGILFISAELEEVVRCSDRILVLRDRAAAGLLEGDEIEMSAVIRRIAGGRKPAP